MIAKSKLICVAFFCAWLARVPGQDTKQSPALLIIGDYFSGDFGGGVDHRYTVLRAFLVNYSNDTLKYWGTTCRPTTFFNVTKNGYMELTDADCGNSPFEEITIPPHRSELIPLHLLINKQPKSDIELTVNMNFYSWFKSDDFERERKNYKPHVLTDKIILRYNTAGNMYYSRLDRENEEKKTMLNLPTKELYLLSNNERKLYKITVETSKITTTIGEQYSFAGRKVYLIPVTVHNNSNDTLKYYSMSCSWQEFYHSDNKAIEIVQPPCDNNVPEEIKIPPKGARVDNVSIICTDHDTKTPLQFKIGLNINKNVENDLFNGYDDELRRFNIVWSDQVILNIN